MYLLGYDIGSSSVKACLVEVATGRIVSSNFFPKEEMAILAVKPGCVDLATREDKEDYFPDFDKFKRFIKVLTSVGHKLDSIVSPTGISESDIFHIEDYSSTIKQE